jgi:hypothetical protein
MTAFLVESYQNLRQDPTDVMIHLMQQFTTQTQSYVLNGSFLNSTAPPPPQLPIFTPSVNAIRINVLWFASLTLSLASASFAILVKQWLREYLAGDYTSPQARLRIRHFRNPGLAHWYVFEIAAVIPLLLQLSLALFLVGLCFFTFEVHKTVGYTTIPLVAGWAFLFIASSFAPVFSPRCPYKTTLLKSIMKVARKQLFWIIRWMFNALEYAHDVPKSVTAHWSYKNLGYDEENAAMTNDNDVDILIAVDAIQADNQLVNIMWDALQQSRPDPADSVAFVQKILSHRTQPNITSNPPPSFLDLTILPEQTVTSIMLTFAEMLKKEIHRQAPVDIMKVIEWSDWMTDCVYILFSQINVPAPASVNQVFTLLLTDRVRYKTFFKIIRSKVPNVETASYVLKRLEGAIILMPRKDILSVLLTITQEHFADENTLGSPEPQKLIDLILEHPEIPSGHIRRLVDITILAVTDGANEATWPIHLSEMFEFIIEFISYASWHEAVIKLVQTMLIQSANTYIYCRWPMGLHNRGWRLRGKAQDLFIDAILAANDSGKLYGSQPEFL